MEKKIKFFGLTIILIFVFALLLNFFFIVPKSSSEVNRIDTNKNVAMLTFDDGPGGADQKILDILNEKNIHATFFYVVGNLAKFHFNDDFISAHPEYKNTIENDDEAAKDGSITSIVTNILKSGNYIGNHTYNHQKYPNKVSTLIDELKRNNILISEVYKEVLGVTITAAQIPVRMPYMQYFPGVEYAINHAGNKIIARGYLGTDYLEQKTGAGKILYQYESHLKKGIIFCCHSKDFAAIWLPILITDLEDKGYHDFATFWPKEISSDKDSSYNAFSNSSYTNYGKLVR